MNIAIYIVFALTYVLIASRRLSVLPIGRPAGAMVGALLMVVIGALSPSESYKAIDHDTILLLFSMMCLSTFLEQAGFFEWISTKILMMAKTPVRLLAAVSLLSGGLSAFLVNDTVCVFLTMVIITMCRKAKLPYAPYLLALATSANIGSSATLVGNPQNMIIGSLSKMEFAVFIRYAGLPAIIGLALNIILLWVYYHRQLPSVLVSDFSPPEYPVRKRELIRAIIVTIGIAIGFFAGFHLGYTALFGVTILIILDARDSGDVRRIFAGVDWTILLFFCCLFIVVAGLATTNIIVTTWKRCASYLNYTTISGVFLFTILMTIGSNLVSNVPMVLLAGPLLHQLGSEQTGWVLLAFITTVAGNLTLIGSVANIIVIERARDHYQLGFWEYFKFGFVSTLVVLAAGVTVICLTMN